MLLTLGDEILLPRWENSEKAQSLLDLIGDKTNEIHKLCLEVAEERQRIVD